MLEFKNIWNKVQTKGKELYKDLIEPKYKVWSDNQATKAKENYLSQLNKNKWNDVPVVQNQLSYALKHINSDCVKSDIKDKTDISRINTAFFTKIDGKFYNIAQIDKEKFLNAFIKYEFPVMDVTLIKEKLNIIDKGEFIKALNRIFYDNACSAHKRYEDIWMETMKTAKYQMTLEESERICDMQGKMIVEQGVPFREDCSTAQLHVLDIKEEINGEIRIYITFVDIPLAREFAEEYASQVKERYIIMLPFNYLYLGYDENYLMYDYVVPVMWDYSHTHRTYESV